MTHSEVYELPTLITTLIRVCKFKYSSTKDIYIIIDMHVSIKFIAFSLSNMRLSTDKSVLGRYQSWYRIVISFQPFTLKEYEYIVVKRG